jgi:threonine aldolase
MKIDLRSDTVTRPTPAMLEAMIQAEVGDDVLGDDPTVQALEEKAAAFFGAESAIFCPSGTMTNQIAMQLHLRSGDEVICHPYSHIYNYEGGGIAANAGSSVKFIDGPRGKLIPGTVAPAYNNPDDPHAAHSALLSVENTANKGGGACYDFDDLIALGKEARELGLKYHMDGARLWNAMIANEENPSRYGEIFDTISVCLSKGMGCPVGSLLLGSEADMKRAVRIRKRMGGGMRQAGLLAAAGIYAMDHHFKRLTEDHHRAKILGDALLNTSYIERIDEVQTNIVIFYAADGVDSVALTQKLSESGILITSMGQGKLRMVTHLDFTEEMLNYTLDKLKDIKL